MALSDDDRNVAAGHVDNVTIGTEEHSEIVLSVTIEAAQWETIKGSSVEAADFVSWLAENVAE